MDFLLPGGLEIWSLVRDGDVAGVESCPRKLVEATLDLDGVAHHVWTEKLTFVGTYFAFSRRSQSQYIEFPKSIVNLHLFIVVDTVGVGTTADDTQPDIADLFSLLCAGPCLH